MIVNAFNDVPDQTLKPSTNTYGKDTLNVAAMQVGFGDKSFKSDDQGIWLGANEFVDAPFSVDMDGNITATSLDLSGYLTKTDTNQPMSGTIRLGTGSGTASIILDGANKRIIINDGSYDRILLGYGAGLF